MQIVMQAVVHVIKCCFGGYDKISLCLYSLSASNHDRRTSRSSVKTVSAEMFQDEPGAICIHICLCCIYSCLFSMCIRIEWSVLDISMNDCEFKLNILYYTLSLITCFYYSITFDHMISINFFFYKKYFIFYT